MKSGKKTQSVSIRVGLNVENYLHKNCKRIVLVYISSLLSLTITAYSPTSNYKTQKNTHTIFNAELFFCRAFVFLLHFKHFYILKSHSLLNSPLLCCFFRLSCRCVCWNRVFYLSYFIWGTLFNTLPCIGESIWCLINNCWCATADLLLIYAKCDVGLTPHTFNHLYNHTYVCVVVSQIYNIWRLLVRYSTTAILLILISFVCAGVDLYIQPSDI